VEPTPGYAAVQSAFLREEFELVPPLAQAFISHNPDAPEISRVWVWLALSLDRLQRSSEALNELDRLKSRLASGDPLWSEVLFWEGDVSRRAFQMVRAKLAYQRLLERYPDSTWVAQAQLGLGLIALHQQAFESAIGYFQEVASRQPGSPAALDALLFEGLCHLQLRHFAEAAAIVEPLLGQLHEPGVIAQAAFYLGESFSALGRYEDAVQAYHRAIASSPTLQWRQPALFGLGWAHYQTNRCEESVRAFERYLTEGTADHRTEALFAQGSCLLRLEREREALLRFEQIVSSEPTHPLAVESALIIADAYRRRERFTLAKELLHTLLRHRLDPVSHAKIQLRLGTIALEQGNAAQAKTILSLAAQSKEPSIRQAALSGLGDVQMFLGEFANAQRYYEESTHAAERPPAVGATGEISPSLSDYATYQVGRIRLQMGAFDEAIAIFQRLTASEDAALADDARLALVITYLNQREEGLARSLLATIRRQRPTALVAARGAYYEALLALRDGDELAVQRLCQEAIAKAPQTDEAFEARLLLADLRGRVSSTREVTQELQQVYASERLPRAQRAKLAMRLGDLARAQRAYAEAIRWYDETMTQLPALRGEALYRAASCYEEAGDIEIAMHWYQQIDQPPWHVRGQLAAAKLLERQDRSAEAEMVYERLAQEPIPEAKLVEERLAALRGAHP
jgi:tetratricopeptide (TPR) repeat protein